MIRRWCVVVVATILLIVGYAVWGPYYEIRSLLPQAREELRGIASSTQASSRSDALDSLMGYQNLVADDYSEARLLIALALRVRPNVAPVVGVADLQAIDLEKCSVDDVLLATRTMQRVNRRAELDYLLGKLVTRQTQRVEVVRLAMQAFYDLGRHDEVLELSDELSSLAPQDPMPWLMKVYVNELRGKLNYVIEPLRRAIELTPTGSEKLRTQLVEYLIQLRQQKDARQEFDKFRKEQPNAFPRYSLTEARLLNLEGDMSGAMRICEQLDAKNPAVPVLMAEILLELREPQKVIDLLKPLSTELPAAPEPQYLLGQAYSRLGQTEQANVHLDRHRFLVRALTETLKLEKIAGQQPGHVDVRLQLSSLYQQLGIQDRASHWQAEAERARQRNE